MGAAVALQNDVASAFEPILGAMRALVDSSKPRARAATAASVQRQIDARRTAVETIEASLRTFDDHEELDFTEQTIAPEMPAELRDMARRARWVSEGLAMFALEPVSRRMPLRAEHAAVCARMRAAAVKLREYAEDVDDTADAVEAVLGSSSSMTHDEAMSVAGLR